MYLGNFTHYGKEYKVQLWAGERLGPVVAIDTETTFVPFTETPDCVTIQAYDGGDTVYYVRVDEFEAFHYVNKKSIYVFHNFPFDHDVLERVEAVRLFLHDKLENNTIFDTSTLYKLLHLATIGYIPPMNQWSLRYLAKKFLNKEIIKDETRENFGQFLGMCPSEIPFNYLEYGAIDSIITYELYNTLLPRIMRTGSTTMLSSQIQTAGSLALNRIYKRGIGFNVEARNKFIEETDMKLAPIMERLAMYGYVIGAKGNKEGYRRAIDFLDIKLPITEDGSYSQKEEDLEPYRKVSFIDDFLTYNELKKASDFVRPLTDSRIHPRYDPLKNTGRTGCSKPNFQNIPRIGGLREMYQAKPGHTFIITDYSAIELATLAQVAFKRYGHSVMMDRINAGECLHYYYASIFYNKDVSEVTKAERQTAKAPNFGFPGGLGIDTFREFAAGYGMNISRSEAQQMKDIWFEAFPEMVRYMQDTRDATWTLTGRKRANASYCADKNTPFQGLAADGAKIALYYLDHAGIPVVGFVHDEIISEVPEKDAERLKKEQEEIMIKSMRVVCPDVDIKVESQISKVYLK